MTQLLLPGLFVFHLNVSYWILTAFHKRTSRQCQFRGNTGKYSTVWRCVNFFNEDCALQWTLPPSTLSQSICLCNALSSTHSCPKHTLWQCEKLFIYIEKQPWDSASVLCLWYENQVGFVFKKFFLFFSFYFLFYFSLYIFLPVLLPTAMEAYFHQEVHLCITHGQEKLALLHITHERGC